MTFKVDLKQGWDGATASTAAARPTPASALRPRPPVRKQHKALPLCLNSHLYTSIFKATGRKYLPFVTYVHPLTSQARSQT